MNRSADRPNPPGGCPPARGPSAETLLTLITGVLAGVTSTYAGTHSVIITVLATIAAIALASVLLFVRQ